MDETNEIFEYGINTTKRPTVVTAEELLGKKHQILDHGSLQLVDYMGGDAAIINAATNYYGLAAVENIDAKDFLLWLRTQSIRRPFKFAEVKVNIAAPIDAALTIVPFEEASVNEYSGRYSVMPDEFYNAGRRNEVQNILHELHSTSRTAYDDLISPDIDLSRELARSVLPLSNYTRFYWKVNLESLFTFLKENQTPHETLAPYITQLRTIAKAVAPLSYQAFVEIDECRQRYNNLVSYDEKKIRTLNRIIDTPYGRSETRRFTVENAEEELFAMHKLLDHGYVSLVDYMGSDESIVQAARVSYGRGTKKVSEDRGLVRYLARHVHTTPSEMIELSFLLNMPFITQRQLIRHRTLDKTGFLQKQLVEEKYYVPNDEELRSQLVKNKQGRGELLVGKAKRLAQLFLRGSQELQKVTRHALEEQNVDDDTIRRTHGVGFYTNMNVKSDVKNLLHFYSLRLDDHAQKEIRVFAQKMAAITQKVAPEAYTAFVDYNQQGLRLSRLEKKAFSLMHYYNKTMDDAAKEAGLKGRELQEFTEKMERLKEEE